VKTPTPRKNCVILSAAKNPRICFLFHHCLAENPDRICREKFLRTKPVRIHPFNCFFKSRAIFSTSSTFLIMSTGNVDVVEPLTRPCSSITNFANLSVSTITFFCRAALSSLSCCSCSCSSEDLAGKGRVGSGGCPCSVPGIWQRLTETRPKITRATASIVRNIFISYLAPSIPAFSVQHTAESEIESRLEGR
jgi:hypothetical protein